MKKEPKSHSRDDLPIKPVLDELTFLRKAFRDLINSYSNHVEGALVQLRESVNQLAQAKKISSERAHEMREMLMLMRGLDIKPAKGKRRDFKKMETLLEELSRLTEGWD